MKIHPVIFAVTCCAVLGTSTGCATKEAPIGQRFGDAVSLTTAQQVINPGAGLNQDPVAGLDGKAAKSGFDAYQKSYKAPEPQSNTFTIGIGGGAR